MPGRKVSANTHFNPTADADFRQSQLIRLRVLERHIEEGRLDEELSWRAHPTHDVAS